MSVERREQEAPAEAGVAGGRPDEAAGPMSEMRPTAHTRRQSQPVRWRRLGGAGDPAPQSVTPRAMDRGRRIGIVLSHGLFRMDLRGAHHVPPDGPLVVVANHSAFVDGPVLFGMLPRRISFLVKSEAVRGPLGWLLRTVGQYAINREAPERGVLMAAMAQLRAGGAIGIFPEGARGSGDVAAVFNGAGWLAARTGAAVVPVAIRGTARPEGRRRRRFHPAVHVLVGEPFDVPQGAGRVAVSAATADIRDRLAQVVEQLDGELRAGRVGGENTPATTGSDPSGSRQRGGTE